MSDATELATGLKTLIDANHDGDNDAAIEAVCKAIRESGCEVDIEIDDDEPDALNGGDYPLWVYSRRTLTVDGETVAKWTRCSTHRVHSRLLILATLLASSPAVSRWPLTPSNPI